MTDKKELRALIPLFEPEDVRDGKIGWVYPSVILRPTRGSTHLSEQVRAIDVRSFPKEIRVSSKMILKRDASWIGRHLVRPLEFVFAKDLHSLDADGDEHNGTIRSYISSLPAHIRILTCWR